MSALFAIIKPFLAVIALAGYIANGAQSHLVMHSGETLELQLCGDGGTRSITIEISGGPGEFDETSCCGDCIPATALPVTYSVLPSPVTAHTLNLRVQTVASISPRSPLWPGAPPHGPPTHLTT